MKKLFLSIVLYTIVLLSSVKTFAQDAAVSVAPSSNVSFLDLIYDNIIVVVAALILMGVILAGLNLIWALIEVQKIKLLEKYGLEGIEKANLSKKSLWERINQKSWNLVPLEKEADIELDHNYDGIRELDNSLPPWWVYLFYFTIIWGVIYFYHYQVSGNGQNQEQEYIAAIESAEIEKANFLSSQANTVDEKTVTLLTDEPSLNQGKEIYVANCAVCHGPSGEGLVGPNFTDKYWLHGGSVNDIFTTIKYGVPEKGMISWKAQLRPADIQKVSSFILSLQGTNPPNQKAPEGEVFEAGATTNGAVNETTKDSLTVK